MHLLLLTRKSIAQNISIKFYTKLYFTKLQIEKLEAEKDEQQDIVRELRQAYCNVVHKLEFVEGKLEVVEDADAASYHVDSAYEHNLKVKNKTKRSFKGLDVEAKIELLHKVYSWTRYRGRINAIE